MEIGRSVYRWIMGQVVAWVWIGGDWWVANVADDGSLKIADDGLDVVWCWRRWWRRWSGGAMGQMVSSIWVLWFRRLRFCVCFVVRYGLIFIFWVQMGWMWQWSGGFFFFFLLNLGFWFRWDFGGQWAWWHGRHGGGGVVMIGLFGCWGRDKDSERLGQGWTERSDR